MREVEVDLVGHSGIRSRTAQSPRSVVRCDNDIKGES